MPFKSKAQARLMYAIAKGNKKADIPKSVAEDYIKASKGMNFKRLREKIGKKKK